MERWNSLNVICARLKRQLNVTWKIMFLLSMKKANHSNVLIARLRLFAKSSCLSIYVISIASNSDIGRKMPFGDFSTNFCYYKSQENILMLTIYYYLSGCDIIICSWNILFLPQQLSQWLRSLMLSTTLIFRIK